VGGLGLDWDVTISAAGSGDAMDFVPGAGLRFTSAGDALTAYSTSAMTATRFEASLANIYALLGIDARTPRIEVYAYYSTVTLTATNQQAALVLRQLSAAPGGSLARVKGGGIGRVNTVRVVGGWNDTGITHLFPYTDNVIGLVSHSSGMVGALFGTWGGDLESTIFPHQATTLPSASQPMRTEENILGLGFRGNSAGGPWTCDLERLIIQAYAA
jgi:hypothetical protein